MADDRDPSPVGDYDVENDSDTEVTNEPDNARADDVAQVQRVDDSDAT